MVWYDIVILAILVYATWQGAQRGLVTQLAWIAALILCFKFADKLAPMIEPQINVDQPLRHWIAMLVLYVGFSLGSFMAAGILNSWMEKAKFKDFDRHLGALLGFLKGVVIGLVVTFFAVTVFDSLKAAVLVSYSGRGACWILDTVKPITPDYFPAYLQNALTDLEKGLSPIHEEHLGDAASISDLWTGQPGSSTTPGGVQGQGVGFQLPDIVDGVMRGLNPESLGSPKSSVVNTGTSFDEMWRTLPQLAKDQFGAQLQQQWNSATPEQKQSLVNNLGRSFDAEVPSVIGGFLTNVGGQSGGSSGGAGTPYTQGNFSQLLNEIGDIYKNREVVVKKTQDYLIGVPPQIQQAVIEDWFADLSLQTTDPDPLTNVRTRLDDRIIRQLDKAGVGFGGLSFDLQQRLNQSRR